MSKKNVITIKNEELNISKVKKFASGYYKIGDIKIEESGDCYKIDNKFYRFETGQIIFNNSIKEYVLMSSSIIYGLIENNKLGYFNSDEKNKILIVLESGTKTFAINEEVLKNNLNYREQLSTGDFVHISLISSKEFNKILKPKNEYKTSLPYDSRGITDNHSDIYNYLYNSNLNNNCNKLGEYLNDLTFGLEFETTSGFVPERITKKLGLIPLRDGSISGIEYVTVPLKEGKGVQTIVDVCKELNKRTIFDNSCALHLHIGGIPRTPEFILAFLKINSWLQNDIFSLFPLYKKYNMGIKNKNYSKPYDIFDIFNKLDPIINKDNINKNFDVLIRNLTSDKASYSDYKNDIKNICSHPADPQDNQKWNIHTRYFFYNFIPLIFGNKQTIEFRIHTPTFNSYKVLMFLLFNSMLIKFTKEHQTTILTDVDFFKKITDSEESRNNLFCFLSFYRNNQKVSMEVRDMINSLRNYFLTRKQETERLTRDGKIEYEEKEIYYNGKIDFNNNRNISLKNENIKLDIDFIEDLDMQNGFNIPSIKSKKEIVEKTIVGDNTWISTSKDYQKIFYEQSLDFVHQYGVYDANTLQTESNEILSLKMNGK